MRKQLITLMSVAIATCANAQMTTCYTLPTFDAGPTGTTLLNGDTFTIKGALAGSGPLAGSTFVIDTTVFSNTGSTVATVPAGGGSVSFTNAVGLISSLSNASIEGLGKECYISDFSYATCTQLSKEATAQITKLLDSGATLSYRTDGSRIGYSLTKADLQKDGTYAFDHSLFSKDNVEKFTLTSGLTDYSDLLKGQSTILKDFTVCVTCVPEPSSALLLGVAGMSLVARRKRA